MKISTVKLKSRVVISNPASLGTWFDALDDLLGNRTEGFCGFLYFDHANAGTVSLNAPRSVPRVRYRLTLLDITTACDTASLNDSQTNQT